MLLPQPLPQLQLCFGQTSCQTARVKGATLVRKSSFISICLRMLQWVRSCKPIRPWFHKSGFKVLSTKSEALWTSGCWSVNSCLGSDFFKTWQQIDSAPAAFALSQALPPCLQRHPPPSDGCVDRFDRNVTTCLSLNWVRGAHHGCLSSAQIHPC